ncbi:hypothetical protein PpBr36_04144 [Pyricularia pennisetigena]|uniref:hypothetical protein n=1 Tax=Pyricularia pennisetigena TaxID=1578925 RepID=UPI00115215F0|nr:hypothetical protein PpBr36_04144 [Pyricularia pennisetigena]TLS27523.1 hypothetical protein PpBr36_04144 [Pyricularia pennisetigena]
MFTGFLVKTWVFIATISLVQAAQVIVGYRTCSELEARPYMNGPALLTRHPAFDSSDMWQLGKGIYTSPRMGEYVPVNGVQWQAEFNQVPKVWIPERMDFKGEATISNFVEGAGCMNECTLRFAPMRPASTNLQMLIPSAMLNDKKPLIAFYAQAFQVNDPNVPNEVLDYNSWSNFMNTPNVQKRSILERRTSCPAACRAKKAAAGSARPPSPAGSRPSSPAGARPPSSAGSKPPSSAGSRAPSPAGARPPSSVGSKPPSSAGSSPSSPAGTKPPSLAGPKRPSSAGPKAPSPAGLKVPSSTGSRTPASAGSKPAGSSRGTTRS